MLRLCAALLLAFSLSFPVAPVALAGPLAALPGLSQVFAGSPPEALGPTAGQLAPCPDSPNCVVSRDDADTIHRIEPLRYGGDRAIARATLQQVIEAIPRATITQATDDYIRVEFASRLMGFVDDSEFYFSPTEPQIEIRSAARLGESDLGVNRRRLEQIRLALEELSAEAAEVAAGRATQG